MTMKNTMFLGLPKIILAVFLLLFSASANAQDQPVKSTSDFWSHVQFGGGLGLNFGSGYTDVMVAPSAIYNFNDYFAAGVGLLGSYVRVKNDYNSYIYGGSLIGLFTPVEELQVSLEMEQLRVNSEIEYIDGDVKDNFWNTALFVGLGYRNENITVGARYNILHDENKTVYYDAFMPFVRVYF